MVGVVAAKTKTAETSATDQIEKSIEIALTIVPTKLHHTVTHVRGGHPSTHCKPLLWPADHSLSVAGRQVEFSDLIARRVSPEPVAPGPDSC